MAVAEFDNAGGGHERLKAVAPVAGAVAVIGAIIGISVFSGGSEAPTPTADVAPPSINTPAPDPVPGVVTPQQTQQGAGAAQGGMEIVVKFKDDARVKDIIDAFWRDQSAGKTRFDTWKANRPEFAGLKLDRVTYSNELVLVHDDSVPARERLAAMRAIVSRLGSVADISYAEPNMTAHPGGQ